jgi:Protein of unknown function (DUF3999)
MTRSWQSVSLGIFAAAPLLAAAAELSLQDFAYEMPITTTGSSSAYRISIPLDVYRNVAHEDLRDIRVFNGRAEVVPYELETSEPKPVTRSQGPSLPLFPLRADARVALDGLRISVQSQGAAVNVQTDERSTEPRAIASYVIDARDISLPLSALQLHWPDNASDFSGSLRVESSDDLSFWRLARSDAPVLSLHGSGAQLVQSRVEFPTAKAKFWRLTWIGKSAPFELSSVSADTAVGPPRTERMRLTVGATSGDDKHREFSFDLGTRLPVNQVNVELPEPNSVAKLQLLSRAHSSDAWRPIAEAEFFRVQRGTSERRNEPINIATNSDRYWLARVTPPGAAISGAAPKFQAAWDAQDLVFLARGNGPFLLAYGDGSAEAAGSALGPLLTGLTVQQAELGARRLAGGRARLQPARVVPWKMVILWSTLGLGVVLLAWMAYRLSREVSRTPAGRP